MARYSWKVNMVNGLPYMMANIDQMCRNCGEPVATDLSPETRQTVETLCKQLDTHPAYTYCSDCYWGKPD